MSKDRNYYRHEYSNNNYTRPVEQEEPVQVQPFEEPVVEEVEVAQEPVSAPALKKVKVILVVKNGCIVQDESGNNTRLFGQQYSGKKVGEEFEI